MTKSNLTEICSDQQKRRSIFSPDTNDLPKELLKELSSRRESRNDQILELFSLADDEPLDSDLVLMGLYRKYGVVYKRSTLSGRLSKLCKLGLIRKTNDRRGFYSLAKGADHD